MLNSLFGATGNPYFEYYDPRVAEAITMSGQLSIQWIAERLNLKLNEYLKTDSVDYIVAIDTDSNYVNLGPLVRAVYGDAYESTPTEDVVNFLDKFATNILEPYIEQCYEELSQYMNAYENKMVMKREVIASSGFWTAKKRYALLVHDSEGVRFAEPKIKIMGLEVVKSSTPEFCRKALKEAINLILTTKDESEIHAFIEETRNKWNDLPVEEIAAPRSVNGLAKFATNDDSIYGKGTPMHVKGALVYNYAIEKAGLVNSEEIKEGEKIKFVELMVPNPTRHAVIAFPSHSFLPKELGLHKYVDYNTQFEKMFIKPLKGMLDAIDWGIEAKNTLDDLFS